jgi:hypothetical protein
MSERSSPDDGNLQLPPSTNGEISHSESRMPFGGGAGRMGRNRRGRFIKGNQGGPGNPFAAQVARVRQEVFAAVSPDIVREIMAALIVRALTGDLNAAKLVLAYAVGVPDAAPDPDEVDLEE